MSPGGRRRDPPLADGPASPRRPAVALAGLLLPPAAWSLQLWALGLLGDLACRQAAGGTFLGLPVEVLWVAISALSALTAAAGLGIAAWSWRRAGADAGGAGDGTVRFLASLGVVFGALFLFTILLGATAPAFVACP